MSDNHELIKRYPNRRYYARSESKYISLQQIEEMVHAGKTVEIRDSQTNEDLTRTVLTQIMMERHPEKMSLFPTDLLHFILRSNEVTSGFLRDYFRHSLMYLEYLQRHSTATTALVQPMHWVKVWLDGISSLPSGGATSAATGESASLSEQVRKMEERLKQLEANQQ